jgi:alkylation response protein AidB-like acyl-CoA dehydrogenase
MASAEAYSVPEVRLAVREWLEENWDADLSVTEWWSRVALAGWVAPQLPRDSYGRELPRSAIVTIREEFESYGALLPPGGIGVHMAAPTIVEHGTRDQVDAHVLPTLDGRRAWCQLFSEPSNGSDLAGLTTRATRDGDVWVIRGQKIWTSEAMVANYGMLLARTNFNVPKHQGISWFAFDMDQPGVEVRPIRQMSGETEFNEVFIEDAICPAGDLIGGEGNGWRIARTTLQVERSGVLPGGPFLSYPHAGDKGGVLTLGSAGEAAKQPPRRLEHGSTGVGAISIEEIIELARRYGREKDPLLRDSIAQLHIASRVGRWTGDRARDTSDPEERRRLVALAKLTGVQLFKQTTALALHITGADGTLWDPDGPEEGRYSRMFAHAPSHSIGGGTDEIQKNLLGEQILGLPRETDQSRDVPFSEVLLRIRDIEAGRKEGAK